MMKLSFVNNDLSPFQRHYNMFGHPVSTTLRVGGMTPQENAGTSIVKYRHTLGMDIILVMGHEIVISTKQHCITHMKDYANKSLEELRLEDYMANRKGPPAGEFFGSALQIGGRMFGQTSTASANRHVGLQGFGPTNNAFGATSQQKTNRSNKPFGQTTTTQTGFRGLDTSTATLFGQRVITFEQQGLSLFGNPQPQTSAIPLKRHNATPKTGFGGGGASQITFTRTRITETVRAYTGQKPKGMFEFSVL